jgi:hypothetical protein
MVKKIAGLIALFLAVGFIFIWWIGASNFSKIGQNVGGNLVISSDPNNKGLATGVTAADCMEKWTTIPPLSKEMIQIPINPACGIPVWQRMIGPETITLTIDGDIGIVSEEWVTGKAPQYEGVHVNRLFASHNGKTNIGIGITYR